MRHILASLRADIPQNFSPLNISRETFSKQRTCPPDCFYWLLTSDSHWLTQLKVMQTMTKHIAVVTDSLQLKEMQVAFSLGARAYCDVNTPINELERISNAVFWGALWIPEFFLSNVVSGLSHHPDFRLKPEGMQELTPREKQVVESLLDGQDNQKIAENLKISVRTVKEHMSSILKKLNAKDRVDLLLKIGDFRHHQ